MGAPTSIFSEIYLQYMDTTLSYNVLPKTRLEGYFRYNILILCNENLTDVNEIHNRFNSILPDLNFTLQLEQDDGLNFLGLTIQTTTKMIFDIYRKSTTSDSIIPQKTYYF